METPQPCNQKQREMFARMLAQAKERAQKELELEGNVVDHDAEEELLTKLVAERGATEQVAKLRRLHQEVEDAEKELERLGFDGSGEAVSLRWNAPKTLRQSLEAAKRSARKEREKSSGSLTSEFWGCGRRKPPTLPEGSWESFSNFLTHALRPHDASEKPASAVEVCRNNPVICANSTLIARPPGPRCPGVNH
jgi:hypothetical protein